MNHTTVIFFLTLIAESIIHRVNAEINSGKFVGEDGLEYCVSYESPTDGAQIIYEKCNPSDEKQSSWTFVELEDGKMFPGMGCLRNYSLCSEVTSKKKLESRLE